MVHQESSAAAHWYQKPPMQVTLAFSLWKQTAVFPGSAQSRMVCAWRGWKPSVSLCLATSGESLPLRSATFLKMTTCLSRLTLSSSSTTMWLASLVTLPRVGIAAMYAHDGAVVPRTINRATKERFMVHLLRCDSLAPDPAPAPTPRP